MEDDLGPVVLGIVHPVSYTHLYLDTPTNQIFLVVDRAQREDLARKAAFSFWEQLDEERTVIRFVTSWATRMEDVEELIRRL